MSIEAELGAIGNFVNKSFGGNPIVYAERMPQDFVIPSIYFQTPTSFDSHFTAHSYEMNYTLIIKLFHDSETVAYQIGEKIANDIRKRRKYIPLLNPDGTKVTSGRKQLYISNVNVRTVDSGAVLMGVAHLTIEWKSRYPFVLPSYEKLMHVYTRLERY